MKRNDVTIIKRISAVFMSLIIVFLLCSCGEEKSQDIESSLVDVTGYEFTICSSLLPSEITEDSTLFERMLFDKIEAVEEELGCDIKIINDFIITSENMQPLIMGGKKVADIIEVNPSRLVEFASAGYIVPLNEVKGLDVNDSKWNKGYTDISTVNGKTYGLSFTEPPEVRYCVMFNKTLLNSCGVDANGIYDLVRNKTWNFDIFRQYCKQATKTSNGSITSWGCGGVPYYVAQMFAAANNAGLVDGTDGKASAAYNSENMLHAMNYYNDLVNNDKVFMISDAMRVEQDWATNLIDYNEAFKNGELGFLLGESWLLNQQIKGQVDFDYGLVPLPMGPNATEYVSPSTNGRSFCITSTNKDIDKTVTILNKLAEPLEGYEEQDWWLEDIQQDYFQSDDKDSLEMYQLCLDNMTYDIGLACTELNKGFERAVVYNSIFWNRGSTVDTAISSLTTTYDEVIEKFFGPLFK